LNFVLKVIGQHVFFQLAGVGLESGGGICGGEDVAF
jgi:hypothetical protein